MYDFKGKRIIVGDKGSGTEMDSRRFLEAIGLSYNDIQPIYVYYAAAVQRMQDEQADALFWTAGVPISSIIEIATTKDVVFLPFPDDIIKKLHDKYPYYAPVTMPAKAYPKQNSPVKTVAIICLWVTRAEVDEKAIYDVTTHLWEKKPQLYPRKEGVGQRRRDHGCCPRAREKCKTGECPPGGDGSPPQGRVQILQGEGNPGPGRADSAGGEIGGLWLDASMAV